MSHQLPIGCIFELMLHYCGQTIKINVKSQSANIDILFIIALTLTLSFHSFNNNHDLFALFHLFVAITSPNLGIMSMYDMMQSCNEDSLKVWGEDI